jgi:N-acetylglucosaminyldiphosphoundecaprenol N-acetyl-beta-D-mannosaminyltransferase
MGAKFAAVTEAEAVDAIVEAAAARRGHCTITANLDHLRCYCREPIARQLIDDADLVVADGTPLIWASQIAGTPLPERVPGSNMVWSISEAASRRGTSLFLLGGNPGAAERAAEVLLERYPGLEVAGTLCPPMGFERDAEEIDRIRCKVGEAAPDIVFVGLGFPKQDLLICKLRSVLPGASFMGVGISLSFVAGEIPRAPAWTHMLGVEWLYRLLQEPRRLVRRYLLQGIPFALQLLTSAAWHRVFPGSAEAAWGWESGDDRTVSSAQA